MTDKTDYDPVKKARKVRKMISDCAKPWRDRLVAATIAVCGFLSGSSIHAKIVESGENPKDPTELTIKSEEVLNKEEIRKAFNENPEEVKQKFCESMADTICEITQQNSDQRISKIKGLKGAQKNKEIIKIFKEVTGTPMRASYCLAGIMSNYMKTSEELGYPELKKVLPESKTYCRTFLEDPLVKLCSQTIQNDTKSIEQYVNMQNGKTFLLFLPRNGGSGFHATLLKKENSGVLVNAYNREHVDASLNSLVDYSRRKVGQSRSAVVVNMGEYASLTLSQELKNCQTAEEFLAFATKGNTPQEIVEMLTSTKQDSGFTVKNVVFEPIHPDQEKLEKDISDKLGKIKERIEENVQNSLSILQTSQVAKDQKNRGKGKKVLTLVNLKRQRNEKA